MTYDTLVGSYFRKKCSVEGYAGKIASLRICDEIDEYTITWQWDGCCVQPRVPDQLVTRS